MALSGVHYADVSRVEPAAVWVLVRRPRGGTAGPYRCRFLQGPGATASPTGATAVGDHGAHTHAVDGPAALAKGDRVLVAFVAGDADQPFVLGRVAAV